MKLKTCLAFFSGLILGVAFAEDGYIQSDGHLPLESVLRNRYLRGAQTGVDWF